MLTTATYLFQCLYFRKTAETIKNIFHHFKGFSLKQIKQFFFGRWDPYFKLEVFPQKSSCVTWPLKRNFQTHVFLICYIPYYRKSDIRLQDNLKNAQGTLVLPGVERTSCSGDDFYALISCSHSVVKHESYFFQIKFK